MKNLVDLCVVLSAGFGTRLMPLTKNKTKASVEIFSKTLLEYTLINLKLSGFKKAICVIRENELDEFLKIKIKDLKIDFVFQNDLEYGSGYALICAKNKIKQKYFAVISCDVLLDFKTIKKARDNFIKSKKNMVVLKKLKDNKNYGVAKLQKNKKIIEFIEKPKNSNLNLVNTSLYFFNLEILEKLKEIKKSKRGEIELTDILIGCFGYVLNQEDFWVDLAYPFNILDNLDFFFFLLIKKIKFTKQKNVKIEKIKENTLILYENAQIRNCEINGNLILQENALVYSSVISGNVFIGKDSKVGPFSFIRGTTSIGKNCNISDSVTVKNSVVSDFTNAKHLSYIGDSIIGKNCNFGSSTQVANYRFDEKEIYMTINKKKILTKRKKLGIITGDNVKFGVSSATMPGIIIGSDCIVGPKALVEKNMLEKQQLFIKQKEMKKNV